MARRICKYGFGTNESAFKFKGRRIMTEGYEDATAK